MSFLLDTHALIWLFEGRERLLAARLAYAHKDPFDRLIAAQSIIEGLTVLTIDPQIAALGAATHW